MTRRLLNLLTVLSLLLCVAVVMLWVRSYWVGDYLACCSLSDHQHTTREDYDTEEDYLAGRAIDEHIVGSERGVLWARHDTGWFTFDQWHPPQFRSGYPQFAPLDGATVLRRLGFGYHGGAVWSDKPWIVMVPHAAPAVTFAAAPAVWLALRVRQCRRARRSARGRCPACGYDLRATPGRCPECGRAAAI